jgi:hypothetical protein
MGALENEIPGANMLANICFNRVVISVSSASSARGYYQVRCEQRV